MFQVDFTSPSETYRAWDMTVPLLGQERNTEHPASNAEHRRQISHPMLNVRCSVFDVFLYSLGDLTYVTRAVNIDHCSGHRGRCVQSEINNGVRYFFGVVHATQRNLFQNRFSSTTR